MNSSKYSTSLRALRGSSLYFNFLSVSRTASALPLNTQSSSSSSYSRAASGCANTSFALLYLQVDWVLSTWASDERTAFSWTRKNCCRDMQGIWQGHAILDQKRSLGIYLPHLFAVWHIFWGLGYDRYIFFEFGCDKDVTGIWQTAKRYDWQCLTWSYDRHMTGIFQKLRCLWTVTGFQMTQ